MIESDTIKLLREADQGIKMGISSIDDVYIKPSRSMLLPAAANGTVFYFGANVTEIFLPMRFGAPSASA